MAPTLAEPDQTQGLSLHRMTLGQSEIVVVALSNHDEVTLNQADRILREEKPQKVFLELCDTRFRVLTEPEYWRNLKIIDALRQGRGVMLLGVLAAGVFLYRRGHSHPFRPGSEMLGRKALCEQENIPFEMADRDMQLTLNRAWGTLPVKKRFRVFFKLLSSLFRKPKTPIRTLEGHRIPQSDIFAAMVAWLPELRHPFLEESDRYFANQILNSHESKKLVFVNQGRLPSLQAALDPKGKVEHKDRELIQKKKRLRFRWILLMAVALVTVIFFFKKESMAWEQLASAWILPNMLLTGGFALLGGAKPLSILSGILVSPFTPLSPALRSGIVVGLVEGWLRKPVVEDWEKVPRDIRKIRNIYQNPLTRVLLVAWLAHTGSSLGNYVGLFFVVRLLY